MGLSREDHGQLHKAFRENPNLYAEMRIKYKDDPLALEQIDIYDGSSVYARHLDSYQSACNCKDTAAQEAEHAWFQQHYPLTTK